MSKKNTKNSPFVYSTDPNFLPPTTDNPTGGTPEKAAQNIKVIRSTKHRGGKAVTLVENFIGTEEEAKEMGKELKTFCGTGGAVKDGEIMVQGDNRDKVLNWLHKQGYTAAKKV